MKSLLTILCVCVSCVVVVAEEFKAGAGAVDITPETGTPMAGYYVERASQGVHDPLMAKAIVISDGQSKAALVALDLISTTQTVVDQAREQIEKETGIGPRNVMISATHSHTGPVLSGSKRYDAIMGPSPLSATFTARLPGLIAEAVKKAEASLTNANVSFGAGREENLGFNRRFHMRDGSIGWNPGKLNTNIIRAAGPTDPTVAVVCFDAGTKPLATYVNFPMHLDTVGTMLFSADYPYTLAQCLARVKGPEMLTVFTIGCAGDINHVNVNWADRQRGDVEAARIGTILGANVLRTFERLTPVTNTQVRVSTEKVRLPLPKITYDDIAEAEKVVARLSSKEQPAPKFLEQVKAFQVLDVKNKEGEPYEVEVQVIAIGQEIAWVSLPGEIFVELGLSIKNGSPFKQTIIAELANGSIGYIPTRRAYTEGNYEPVSARCAEGSGEMLVESAIRQLRNLHGMPSSAPGQ